MSNQPSKDSTQKPTEPWALLQWLTTMEPNDLDRAAIVWGVAEIERLRAALQQIIDDYGDEYGMAAIGEIVHEALCDQPSETAP